MKEACTHDYLLAYPLAWMEVWSKLLSLKHLSEIEKVGRSVKADDRIPRSWIDLPWDYQSTTCPLLATLTPQLSRDRSDSPDDYNIVYFNCSQWSVNSC